MHLEMSFLAQFLLIIFLIQAESNGFEEHTILDTFIQRVEDFGPIKTLVIFRHTRNLNWTLREWNPQGIPTLRSSELGGLQIRYNFNLRAMSLVYIGHASDIELLDLVAETFEYNRQERIVLWSQMAVTKEFLQKVCKKVVQYKFLQLLVLEVGGQPSQLITLHRLRAFPTVRFEQLEDIFNITLRSLFAPFQGNFAGVTAVVKTSPNLGFRFPIKLRHRYSDVPEHRVEDKAVFEFAMKYNLSLRFIEENDSTRRDHFDIQLVPRFIRKRTLTVHLGYTNTGVSTSIIVVVPCGQGRSIAEVFKHLDVQAWLFYIFCVYALLILVETFIILMIYRIKGRTYCLTRINPLVNLRVFRAILGMPFPVSRSEILSLRQLFLAMSIFGMVFSNFFGCKLSALLTKQPDYPQVKNFEELRASGLTVIGDPMIRPFIESELDPKFFQQVIPRVKFVPLDERFRLMLSLNDSYGYILLEESFAMVDSFQRSSANKIFCTSKDLIVAHNLPRLFILANNSYFKWPLSRIVMWIQEAGISRHWLMESPRYMRALLNMSTPRTVTQNAEPLSLKQLKWLWYLLIYGYILATLVLLVEIYLGRGKKGNRRNRRVDQDSVA